MDCGGKLLTCGERAGWTRPEGCLDPSGSRGTVARAGGKLLRGIRSVRHVCQGSQEPRRWPRPRVFESHRDGSAPKIGARQGVFVTQGSTWQKRKEARTCLLC